MSVSAGTSRPTNPTIGLPNGPHARIVITIASMGFFLITLDISIVNVALAQIRAELGGGTVGQQWIIDGYTLMFAALLLFAGNLSDRIGAKKAMALGIAALRGDIGGLRVRPHHRSADRRPLRSGCRGGDHAPGLDGPGS